MAYKEKEKQRQCVKRHYDANRQYYIDKARKATLEKRKWLAEQKTDKPCMDCGISYPPYVMDFDHRDPATKKLNVSALTRAGWGTLKDEIKKCDLVCANCHRLRTFKPV